MNDQQLRKAFKRRLQARFASKPDALAFEELSLGQGASRIDLVMFDGELHGFELKSDSDTLERLPDQIRSYSKVLDRATLVVGYNLAYKALKLVPPWWGVELASIGPRGGISFSVARSPKRNLSLDRFALAGLLWRQEALDLLAGLGGADGVRSKARKAICQRLGEVATVEQIRHRVHRQLSRRAAPQSGVPQTSGGD